MNKFHIIGSGACGFLRIHHMLKNFPIKYKGGGPKYQNSFERWNENDGLIWNSELLSKEERLRRVSLHDTTTNITHSYLKYVPEFLEIHKDIKFLCMRGLKEHSIKSLTISWGYQNPCYAKNRVIGFGDNRYAVSQFPDLSLCSNELEATEIYWNEYYEIAEKLQELYPNNFLIFDSPQFFSDEEYQKKCLNFVGINIPFYHSPINFDDFTITTSLHGGLGNNLFQMSEVISFCEKYRLPDPIFGTWNLWNGGEIYPNSYNCDRFLGGHNGTSQQITNMFPNLNWKENLIATFDTKFVVNNMFNFGKIEHVNKIYETLKVDYKLKENTAALHLRFCTQPADDHVNGFVDDQFYIDVFKLIPKNCNVIIFSDDNNRAYQKLNWFKENFFDIKFEIFDGDSFQTLKNMISCEYHIMHVSTFSFWSAFLDIKQPNNKVFYPKSFIKTHSKNMILYKEWICI